MNAPRTNLAALPDLLTADELAPFVRCSPQHVRKLAKRQGHVLGVEPVKGIGHKLLFAKNEIARAIGASS